MYVSLKIKWNQIVGFGSKWLKFMYYGNTYQPYNMDNQHTCVACILLPRTRYNWMLIYSVNQAPGMCILQRKKNFFSVYKKLDLGFESSACKTNIQSENFRCWTAVIVHFTISSADITMLSVSRFKSNTNSVIHPGDLVAANGKEIFKGKRRTTGQRLGGSLGTNSHQTASNNFRIRFFWLASHTYIR